MFTKLIILLILKYFGISGSIRVFCRIRPFNSVENWRNSFPVSVETDKIKIKSLGSKKEFVVDRAFDQNSTQGTPFI